MPRLRIIHSDVAPPSRTRSRDLLAVRVREIALNFAIAAVRTSTRRRRASVKGTVRRCGVKAPRSRVRIRPVIAGKEIIA